MDANKSLNHITILFFYFTALFIIITMANTTSPCTRIDPGPVVPTAPLVKFLEQIQQIALKTYGPVDFDPKLYLDLSLKQNLSITVKAFENLPRNENGSVPVNELNGFVREYLGGVGEDLVQVHPVDYVAEPEGFLVKVESPVVRDWALEVHGLWKNLSRKVSGRVIEKPEYYTLLPLKNPVVIPGSRFREVYYWDSYWVISAMIN